MEVLQLDDFIFSIGLFLDYDSLRVFRLVYKRGYLLWNRQFFWEQKAWFDLGISPKDFSNTYLPPAHRYLVLFTQANHYTPSCMHLLSDNQFIDQAIRANRFDESLKLRFNGSIELMTTFQLMNYKEIIKRYIQHGHVAEFQKFLEAFGITESVFQRFPPDAVKPAIKRGHFEMIQYIIPKLRQETLEPGTIRYPLPETIVQSFIRSAVESGSLEMVKYVAKADRSLDYQLNIQTVLHSGNKDIVELFDWNDEAHGFYYEAYQTGDLEFVEYIKEKLRVSEGIEKTESSPRITLIQPNKELEAAVRSGKMEMIQHVLQQHPKFDFTYHLDDAVLTNNLSIVQWVIDHSAEIDWTDLCTNLHEVNDPVAMLKLVPIEVLKHYMPETLEEYEIFTPKIMQAVKYLHDLGIQGKIDPQIVIPEIVEYHDKDAIDLLIELFHPKYEDFPETLHPALKRYLKGRL